MGIGGLCGGGVLSWLLPVGTCAGEGREGRKGECGPRAPRAGDHGSLPSKHLPPPSVGVHHACVQQACGYILNKAWHGRPLLW